MALVCKSGARECTACRLCFSASVCEICGRKFPVGKKYYELFHTKICSDCVEISIAEEEKVCSLCGDAIYIGENTLLFDDKKICSCCISVSEYKKNYV